jgi:hypothetical protein
LKKLIVLVALLVQGPVFGTTTNKTYVFDVSEDNYHRDKRNHQLQEQLSNYELLKVVALIPMPQQVIGYYGTGYKMVVLERRDGSRLDLGTRQWREHRYPVGSYVQVCRLDWIWPRDGDGLIGVEVDRFLANTLHRCGSE